MLSFEIVECKQFASSSPPALLFSKLNGTFVGYFDPEKMFLDNKNKCLRGDLTDVSAKQKKH